MRKFIALIVANLVLTSAGYAVGPFVYELNGVPKTKDSAGCVETAHRMGLMFHNATGATVVRSACEREHSRSYDIKVIYETDKALGLVSSESDHRYAGHYASLQLCNQDLLAQQELFEERTKLKAFHAYCYYDQSGIQSSIGSRIDAIGTPAEWPQVFVQDLLSPPGNPAGVVTDLADDLRARGLTPALVAVALGKNAIDYTRIVAKYYGAKEVTYKTKRDQFRYKTTQECETALTHLMGLLFSQGIRPTSAYCTKPGLTGRSAINFIATGDAKWYRVEMAGDRFKNAGECLANRDRIVDFFKTTLKQPVFGAMCAESRELSLSLVNREYRAEVLLPCSSFGSPECRRTHVP